MSKRKITSIQVPPEDLKDCRRLADLRGLKVKHIPRLLLEGWSLLTSDQHTQARERLERRFLEPARRRQPATA